MTDFNIDISKKPYVHDMFFELCDIDKNDKIANRTNELVAIDPLEDGAAFRLEGDREIWHPAWERNINDKVNVQFINAVVERIWQNEEVS